MRPRQPPVPEWAAGYVGIPWAPRGRDRSGCDCWGLVRLALAERFGVDVPSYAEAYAGPADRRAMAAAVAGALPAWREVSGPEAEGDAALFRVAGRPLHVGLVVSPGWMLHSLEGADAAVEPIRSPVWGARLLGFYRPAAPGAPPAPSASRLVEATVFGHRLTDMELPAGQNVVECLGAAGVDPETPGLGVWSGEYAIPRRLWEVYRPAAGECLHVVAVPEGGGGSGKILASIAILAIAITGQAYLAPYVAGLTGSAFAGAAAAAAVTVGGALLVSALVPPALANPAAPQVSDEARAYSLTGARNQMVPFGVVPRVYGVHRYYPPLAAQPYTEIEGDDQYLVMLFDCGYGPLRLPAGEMKIGETEIDQFSGIEVEKAGMGAPVTLYRNTVDTQAVALALEYAAPQTPTTAPDADEAIVQIAAAGLVRFTADGRRRPHDVTFTVGYRLTGTGGAWLTDGVVPHDVVAETGVTKVSDIVYQQVWRTDTEAVLTSITATVTVPANRRVRVQRSRWQQFSWDEVAALAATGPVTVVPYPGGQTDIQFTVEEWIDFDGGFWMADTTADLADPTGWAYSRAETAGQIVISDQRETLVRRAIRVVFPARAQYDVRVERTTPDNTDPRILDETTLAELQTVTYGSPVSSAVAATHNLVALRVKATDQLQGQLDQFSVVAYAQIPVWDGAVWTTRETRNPAWAYCHELRGTHNDAQLADGRIDLAAMTAWADACLDAGREYNAVHDTQATVFERLQAIAAAGRAAYSVANGAYSVVRDVEQTVPIQHFTPRNSWGFRGQKVFRDLPHAYRVRFADRTNDWRVDERVIHVEGYTEETATVFDESLSFPGVTDPDQIARDVYYLHACAKLRPETYEWWADVESIRCTRGDLVRVTHDVPMWGLHWGRIASRTVDGEGKTTSVTLDELVTVEVAKSYAINVRLADGSAVSVGVSAAPGETATINLSVATLGPAPGDLVQFGESTSVAADLLVREIHPGPDLEARIVAVDAAPAVHTADQGELPPWDPQITIPPALNRPAPADPVITELKSVILREIDGTTTTALVLTLRQPYLAGVEVAYLQVQYRVAGQGTWLDGPIVGPGQLVVTIRGIQTASTYQVRVRAVSTRRQASLWVYGTWYATSDLGGPGVATIAGEFDWTARWVWTPNKERDFSHYVVTLEHSDNGVDYVTEIEQRRCDVNRFEVASPEHRWYRLTVWGIDRSLNVTGGDNLVTEAGDPVLTEDELELSTEDAASLVLQLPAPLAPSHLDLLHSEEWNTVSLWTDATPGPGHLGWQFGWSYNQVDWYELNSGNTETVTHVVPWADFAGETLTLYVRYREVDVIGPGAWSSSVAITMTKAGELSFLGEIQTTQIAIGAVHAIASAYSVGNIDVDVDSGSAAQCQITPAYTPATTVDKTLITWGAEVYVYVSGGSAGDWVRCWIECERRIGGGAWTTVGVFANNTAYLASAEVIHRGASAGTFIDAPNTTSAVEYRVIAYRTYSGAGTRTVELSKRSLSATLLKKVGT